MKKRLPYIAFEMEKIVLSLDDLLPVRSTSDPEKRFNRYPALRESVKEVGLVEPLVVYPDKVQSGKYILLDGHMRYAALKELKIFKVECLIATEDEAFTYNARINRLSPIQEHQMIVKAVKSGVSPTRIAKALKRKVEDILGRMNLLEGIHPDAVELLKDKPISALAIAVIRRVLPLRQIEIAELMISANNFSKSYADALFTGTAAEQLAKAKKANPKAGLSAGKIAQMEHELESLEHEFKTVHATYGQHVLNFTMIRAYIRRLLGNAKIIRYLKRQHPDLTTEIELIASMESLEQLR